MGEREPSRWSRQRQRTGLRIAGWQQSHARCLLLDGVLGHARKSVPFTSLESSITECTRRHFAGCDLSVAASSTLCDTAVFCYSSCRLDTIAGLWPAAAGTGVLAGRLTPVVAAVYRLTSQCQTAVQGCVRRIGICNQHHRNFHLGERCRVMHNGKNTATANAPRVRLRFLFANRGGIGARGVRRGRRRRVRLLRSGKIPP